MVSLVCFNQRGDISTLNGGSPEISGQAHLFQKQHLINGKSHHATSKGMDTYQ